MSGMLDGNAMAGELSEIFAVDLTAAVATCAGCKHPSVVATLRVWGQEAGLVARCPSCDDVILRFVRGPERAWLDLRGAVSLQVALPGTDSAGSAGSVAEGPA
jgi:predicted oxidoreductase